jgi:hypothetical protein
VALQLAEDRGRSVVVLLLHIMHSGITKRLQVRGLVLVDSASTSHSASTRHSMP